MNQPLSPLQKNHLDRGFDAFPPEMAELEDQLRRAASQDTTLLFTGETGTGKTRLAHLIHDLSPRRNEPFLVIDCGSLSENLIESEFFGHVKGAFTGADQERMGKLAAAGRGTLFVDEVNSFPLALQSKLLRGVAERIFEPVGSEKSQPFRARLIVATNVPLEQEVAAGRFRADLFYRLNVIGFSLPPLRERPNIIEVLANKFLHEFASRSPTGAIETIAPDAMHALTAFPWPGNIRELRNVIERAVALCNGPEIQFADLPEGIRLGKSQSPALPPPGPTRNAATATPMTLAQSKEEAESLHIIEVLRKHNNNRLRAAAELGISRMGLYKKLHKYGLIES